MTPAWLLDIFAAIMLAVAAVSAARLLAARPWRGGRGTARADIDVAHLLMAIAMAGMLAASLHTLPNGAWEVAFGVLTAWFAYRVVRDAQVSGFRALTGGHCAPHLIHAASMLYMFLALAVPTAHGSGGMGGGMGAGSMGTLEFPTLAYVFTLLLVGYGVWDLDQLSGPGTIGHYSLAAARVAPVPVLAGVGSGGTAAGPGGYEPRTAMAGPDQPGPDELRSDQLRLDELRSDQPRPDELRSDRPRQAEPGSAPRVRGGGPADGQGRGILAPWVAISGRIAMGVTMAFMLVITI
jgi:hypothetical protein